MAELKHIGKYEILEEIGHGGFAVVYKARDPSLDQLVAVKVLRGAHAEQPDVVQRFLDEARKAVKLRHRGIVRIYAVGEEEGAPYIAMEYLPGGTLADRLHGQPLPLDGAITIVEQIAAALDHAHKRDLVHRDVKPANVLFDDEGKAVLVDFGLVKSLVESGLTVEGTSLGTPHYMAPEQANTAAEIDARADVYALGVVAYQMLTGRVPFEAETPLTVLHAHAHDAPPDPCALNQSLDEGIAAALLKSLEKGSAERYQSAGAFARALRGAEKAAQRAAQMEATLETLYAEVQEALGAGRWGVVVNLCVEMRNLDPDYRDVSTLLTLAASRLAEEEQTRQQERELGERYAAALDLLEKTAYAEAIKALEEIAEQASDYRGVQEKLVQARDEHQRAQWYDEAVGHSEAGQWSEACRLWVQILRGQLDYHDGEAARHLLDATGGLLGQRDKLQKWAHEVTSLYDAFVVSIEAEEWDAVVENGEKLLKVAPGLSGPQVWLDRVRRELLLPPSPPPSILPLTILAGRYVIMEKIAQGDTGAIYKAQDKRLQDKIVAVKEMSESIITKAERKLVLESFQREVELLARLDHPNLARVSDRFQEVERHYVVMEFIEGQTLQEMLKGRSDPFPEEQVLDWAGQLCDVLTYLHSQKPKIIYRDMKPANVMVLAGSDQVKLIDFGIARFYKPGKKKDTIEFGTDGYAPPEQYGKTQTDERSDVYALGATLHQLLTLRDPMDRPFLFPSVCSLNPKVSKHVDAAIAKAVEADRDKRHQSTQEMWESLLNFGALRL